MFCFFWFQAIRCHQFTGSRRFVYDKTLNNHFSMYETQSKSPLRIEITWAFMLLLTTPVIHKYTYTWCCCCSKWAVLSLSFSGLWCSLVEVVVYRSNVSDCILHATRTRTYGKHIFISITLWHISTHNNTQWTELKLKWHNWAT